MKKIITLILLFASLVVHAQQVDTVEYFFDKDPGFGKGTKLPLAGTNFDTAINFTAGNLPSGVHDLFVRLKNTKNQWSTLYQSTLLITNGIAGAEKITEAEYFYDTDPGFGKGKQLTLNAATIDSSLAFTVTGLTTGPHTIYIRLKDNNNQWSTVYQSSFLLSSGSAAGKIVEGEYFFDTDPGFGKGTQITMNSTTLDSSFNFSVTGLSTGVHTVYIRLKNSENNWSFPYQGNFVVTSGTAGTPMLQSMSYFVDSIKNAIQLPLISGTTLDTTLSIAIPDNGADARTLGIQVKDQTGAVSNATLEDISLCYLYKPIGGFRTAQYASTFTLIDTSHFNTSQKVRWYENGVLADSGLSINYKFPADNIGSETIMQITGKGCRVDTAVQTLNMPGIENYSPWEGSYNSDFTLTLYGAGLDSNLNIYLQKGDTTIYPYLKYTTDGQTLLAIFNLHDYPLNVTGGVSEWDSYKVHVKYTNGYEYVGPYQIEIVKSYNKSACNMYYNDVAAGAGSGGGGGCSGCSAPIDIVKEITAQFRCPPVDAVNVQEPYFATDLTGNTTLKSGVWNNLNISLTNTGTLVGKEIPVYVLIPANFEIDTTAWQIVGNYSKLQDSLSIILPAIDTIINGQRVQYNLVGLIQPILGPGQTQMITLRVRTTQVGNGDIYYWAAQRFFGSANLLLGPCLGGAVDLGIGFIPVLGQLNAAWDWGWSIGTAVTNYEFHVLYGDPWNPSQDLGSITLNTAGMLLSVGGAGKLAGTDVEKIVASDLSGSKSEIVIMNSLGATGSGSVALGSDQLSDDPCIKLNQNGTPKKKPTTTRSSFDPNHIYGNSDYDTTKNYINNYSPQSYSVTFENKPTATANAQHVYVTDTLNANKFDLHTFKLTRFTIADSTYNVPAYRLQATKDVAIKGRKDLKVRFAASYDSTTGILRADFLSIDSAGHILPQSSVDGFLPPDKDGVSGTAGLGYSVYVRNLNTLDTFANKAVIYFDNNAPLATNTWVNTVDTTAPVSKILKAIRINDTTVKLVIQKTDIGSGNWYNSLFVKGPLDTSFHRIVNTESDTFLIKGILNKTYQFYTAGTDYVSNQEKKTTADITYKFSTALPVTFLSFNAAKAGDSVQVSWSTGSEINVLHYDVEKSNDATTFTVIGNVPAGGLHNTNNYVLFDAHPGAVNYYRIREVDNDGKYTYTRVIRIDFGSTATLSVSPVPAHNYLNINGASNFDRIEFFDVSGRVVKQFNKTSATTFNIADLSNGTYFIRFTATNNVQTVKFIKQ